MHWTSGSMNSYMEIMLEGNEQFCVDCDESMPPSDQEAAVGTGEARLPYAVDNQTVPQSSPPQKLFRTKAPLGLIRDCIFTSQQRVNRPRAWTHVAMLKLNCANFQAAHVLVWHLGVLMVSAAFGALCGWRASKSLT